VTATPALTLTTAADKVLYLTFDDGPFSPNTEAILDLLAQHGARATFFVVGTQAAARPALLERIHAGGHGLANHTWGHRSLEGASWETFAAQVTGLGDLLGEKESKCLRPPYSKTDANTFAWAEALGYRVVLYSADPEDWKLPGDTVVAQRIVAQAQPGAIIVLHDGGGDRTQTVAALAAAIPALKAEGYRFEALCRDSFPAPRAPEAAPALVPVVAAAPEMEWADGSIVAPAFGSTLSGAAEVVGMATASDFGKWQLDLLLYGSAADAAFLALGDRPMAAPALLLAWDTRPFPNGAHTLRLRVVRNDGNYMEWYTRVVIAN
jgi:peptidoglycan/xylan/chitin deacetylase (PgdA/CDA1 family)